MVLKEKIIKILVLVSLIFRQTTFTLVEVSGQIPQPQIQQQAIPQPEEHQDEYAFKKGFRNIHNTTALGYYLLMYFYAGFNGATSEVFKAGLLTPLPSTTAPFALEAIDFVGNEI